MKVAVMTAAAMAHGLAEGDHCAFPATAVLCAALIPDRPARETSFPN